MTTEINDVKQIALAFCWRLVYEGLGLSGYSPRASAAMRVIDCAKSDSKKGWRVAKSVGLNPVAYNYAFLLETDGPNQLDSKSWIMISGPEELCELLGEDTNITPKIACEMIESAAVLKTYKKIEQEGVGSISEKSGYFKYVQTGIITGALRRIGQGDTESTVANRDPSEALWNPEFDELTAPGMALTRLTKSYNLTPQVRFDPLANLLDKISSAHENIILAAESLKEQEENEELI